MLAAIVRPRRQNEPPAVRRKQACFAFCALLLCPPPSQPQHPTNAYTCTRARARANSPKNPSLVAVLERRAAVYDLQTLAPLRALDTPPNARGLAALTPAAVPGDPCLLALPSGDGGSGALQVYDLAAPGGAGAAGGVSGGGGGVQALAEVSAHKAPLAAMAWSADGGLLATASATGTVVRVHALQPGASRLFSFRRGSTPATVHCLAFGPGGGGGGNGGAAARTPRLLAAASSHGTIHIFRLEPAARSPAAAAASAAAGLLSAAVRLRVADVVNPVRDVLTVRLPSPRAACVCALQRGSGNGGGGGAAAADGGSGGAAADGGSGGDDDQVGFLRARTVTSARCTHAVNTAVSTAAATTPLRTQHNPTRPTRQLTLVVATSEGLLYEYALEGLLGGGGGGADGGGGSGGPQAPPRSTLSGEWALLGSAGLGGGGG